MTIRILICDDQVIVCEGLQVILEAYPDLEVVGIANDGEEAVQLTAKHQPDIVLMDLKMPVMNGIQATKLIRERYSNSKVIALTTFDADEWVFDAIRAGASGYLLKDNPRDTLIKAIRDTVDGKTHVDPSVAGKLFEQFASSAVPMINQELLDQLSEREQDVLKLIAQGMTNAEIAEALFISKGTVSNYVSTILEKLDVADRTQAAVLALRHGLVDT